MEAIQTKQRVRYITVEKYPLTRAIWEVLNYSEIIPNSDAQLFVKLHEAAWDNEVRITDQFTILKLSSGLEEVDYLRLPKFDLVYFDAFSQIFGWVKIPECIWLDLEMVLLQTLVIPEFR